MDVVFMSFGELIQRFLSPDPSIEMHRERPCLTYAQRIDPSSDWFVGLSNACATDEDGRWLSEITADVIAHDAGTAEGEDFMPKGRGHRTAPADHGSRRPAVPLRPRRLPPTHRHSPGRVGSGDREGFAAPRERPLSDPGCGTIRFEPRWKHCGTRPVRGPKEDPP